MIVIIVRRFAEGTMGNRFIVLAGNALLWLVPFAGRAIFRDKIGDALWAVFVIFAFFASFLGSVEGLYGSVWWYDLAMHTLFGYIGGFIGLFFLCKLADADKLRPLLVILFCFAVSLMFAALWEVFEFAGDKLLGNNAQGVPVTDINGDLYIPVDDTMEDIICNTVGALVFAAHYAAHVLSKRSLLLAGAKRDFCPPPPAPPNKRPAPPSPRPRRQPAPPSPCPRLQGRRFKTPERRRNSYAHSAICVPALRQKV